MSLNGDGTAPGRHRRIALADADPELGRLIGEGASGGDGLTLPSFRLPRGPLDGLVARVHPQRRVGLMIVSGAILHEITMLGRTSGRLLGPGDLIRPWSPPRPSAAPDEVDRWTVIAEANVADIDALLARNTPLPRELVAALLGRSVDRTARASVDMAVVSQVRVEVRVLACLWELAERWGRVTPDGVHIELPLTHAILAALVAAHRPTVTNAIQRLEAGGYLMRDGRRMVLLGDPGRVRELERTSSPRDEAASDEEAVAVAV